MKKYDLSDASLLLKLQFLSEKEIIETLSDSYNANHKDIFRYIRDINILKLVFQHTDIDMQFFNDMFNNLKENEIGYHRKYHPLKYMDSPEKLQLIVDNGFDIDTLRSAYSPFLLIEDDNTLDALISIWKPTLKSKEEYMYFSLNYLIKYSSSYIADRIDYLIKNIPDDILQRKDIKDTTGQYVTDIMESAFYAVKLPVIQSLYNRGLPVLDMYIEKTLTSISFQQGTYQQFLTTHIYNDPEKKHLYLNDKEKLLQTDIQFRHRHSLLEKNEHKLRIFSEIGEKAEDFIHYCIELNKKQLNSHITQSSFSSTKHNRL